MPIAPPGLPSKTFLGNSLYNVRKIHEWLRDENLHSAMYRVGTEAGKTSFTPIDPSCL